MTFIQSLHEAPKWPYIIARLGSAIAIIGGTLAMLGWLFYYWLPNEYKHVVININPNTAICFILSGISLWLLHEKNNRLLNYMSKIAAAAVFLIGFLTLFEYFFKIELGIDQGLFRDTLKNVTSLFSSGRMTPFTATNFVLIGLTLFFIDSKTIRYPVHQLLILLVILNTYFQLLVHLYSYVVTTDIVGVTNKYSQVNMSVLLLFLMLSAGIFFARPDKGIAALISNRESGSIFVRRIIVPACILPILFGYLEIVAEHNGHYEHLIGVSLLIMVVSLFFITLILLNAYFVNHMEIHSILYERDERLSLALRSADAGTWNWDVKTNQIMCDEYLHRLFGLEPQTNPSRFETIFNFIHPDDRKRVDDEIKEALLSKKDYESEYKIILPDGQQRCFATRGHIFRNEKGDAIKMSGICWDITQRKSNEEELRKAKEQAELLAEQANSANKAKSAFLAAMSHEIRTPLNGIIGMTSLAEKTTLTAEQSKMIDTIRLSGEALMSVINDVLDFSKIESGQMDIEFIEFNLYKLISDIVDLFYTQVEQKKIKLNFSIAPNVPLYIKGDPAKLRQILTNILSNSVKFTQKGEINVRVLVQASSSDDALSTNNTAQLRFEIQDTGIGISHEAYSRLFQPFSQGDVSTSRKYGGTGLGLVICQRLVNLMHGTMGVDSISGIGTRFWFTIKLEAAENNHPSLLQNDICLPDDTFILDNQYFHILLAEDNSVNQMVSLQLLKQLGYTVDSVENGIEAVNAFRSTNYDLILMDCQMPEMDGYLASEMIRKLHSRNSKTVPIIALTAHALKGEKEKCLAAGMNDYLSKPININHFKNMLDKWLHSNYINNLNEMVSITERTKSIFDNNNNSTQAFLDCFISSTNEILGELTSAIKQHDNEKMKLLIHRLKGSAGNSGAINMHQLCIKAEKALLEDNRMAFNAIVNGIKQAFIQLEKHITQSVEIS